MKKSTVILIVILVFFVFCIACGAIIHRNHTPKNPIENQETISAEAFYEGRDLWDTLEEDVSGKYQTGYYFIDIDLDGKKELAVQMGGDETNNCKTKFYRIENHQVAPVMGFMDDYSLAISNLEKYTNAEGEEFFLNKYTLKHDDRHFESFVDKISKDFKVQTLFYIQDEYGEDATINSIFYANDQEISREEYTSKNQDFFKDITLENSLTFFIPHSTWKGLSEAEQKSILEKSYQIDETNYQRTVADEIIKPIDTSYYQPISITLNDAIYGSELLSVQEFLGDDVSAQVYTDQKSFIFIMPNADMLDNMIFYYQNNQLVAYVREFTGIGGKVIYYFQNGQLQSIDKSQIEPEMDFQAEDTIAIKIKAESAWAEYGR